MGLCESKSYKPWFDKECLKLVHRRKYSGCRFICSSKEVQWLQDTSIVNEDNLLNVKREAGRYFRNKIREYLKGKITDIELSSKNKNIRDLYSVITEFKKGYQPKTNLVKDERGDLLADPQKNLTMWKNYFTQQSHLCQSLVLLSLRSLSERWKSIKYQVLIRFQQD
jgi:hypothetical protein